VTDTADPPRPAAGDDPVEVSLQRFLAERTQAEWTPEQDIFADGGMSSLFALQLVLYLEQEFGVEVSRDELKLDNFRTVRAMAELVHRLEPDGTPG
jgi:methoxymalonate biosynthesis acyl carrier protein